MTVIYCEAVNEREREKSKKVKKINDKKTDHLFLLLTGETSPIEQLFMLK